MRIEIDKEREALGKVIKADRQVLEMPLEDMNHRFELSQVRLISRMFTPGDEGAALVDQVQRLFDATFQDRPDAESSGHKPRQLQVEGVVTPVCWPAYQDYMSRRREIFYALNRCQPFEVTTDGISVADATEELETAVNEKLLFHGTFPSVANSLLMSRVRSQTVHAAYYGKGATFLESSTKADQYAKADERGLYPMILSRVLLGSVRNLGVSNPTDSFPDDEYKQQLIRETSPEGDQYNSICGDRRRPPQNSIGGYYHYREFVLYDERQSMPLYLVWYRRVGETLPSYETGASHLTDEDIGQLDGEMRRKREVLEQRRVAGEQ